MASTLSKLHLTSPSGAGLASFGSASNYCRRQVRRWSQQYRASISPAAPEVLQLVSWLESHIPADDASPASPAICHGDYRLDNLVVDTANGDKVRTMVYMMLVPQQLVGLINFWPADPLG